MVTTKQLKMLRKILLTASLLTVVGCQCFPTPPVIKPKQIVARLGVCKVYSTTLGKTMTFKYEYDIPIEDCLPDGHFVLTDTELVEMRRAYNQARACIERGNCKVK